MAAACWWQVCFMFLRLSRIAPILIVLGIVLFSTYVYVFATVPGLTENVLVRSFCYVVFLSLLFMFLISYFFTILTPLPTIPQQYYLTEEVYHEILMEKSDRGRNTILFRHAAENSIPIATVSSTDGPRFCPQCKCIKPDRAHHCSLCGSCVLRYDHHCPWTAGCVNHMNYKSFLLFLMYGLLLCIFVLCTSLPSFVNFWQTRPMQEDLVQKFSMVFLPFLALLFGISLGCLFVYHVFLVIRNRTTIEQWIPPNFEHGPDKSGFNLGAFRNFKQIFGNKWILWWWPKFSGLSDGLQFPLSESADTPLDSVVSSSAHTSTNNIYYSCSSESIATAVNGRNEKLMV